MLCLIYDIFLLFCFLSLKESTFETSKNVFLFHFKIYIFNIKNLKFHDVIKYPSMKQEEPTVNSLGSK